MRTPFQIMQPTTPPALFWCTTPSGAEDYWVVAYGPNHAKTFFAIDNGFRLDRVASERILELPERSRVYFRQPETPSLEFLESWGVHYNGTFHVFRYNERIFRPQALVRRLLVSGRLREDAS